MASLRDAFEEVDGVALEDRGPLFPAMRRLVPLLRHAEVSSRDAGVRVERRHMRELRIEAPRPPLDLGLRDDVLRHSRCDRGDLDVEHGRLAVTGRDRVDCVHMDEAPRPSEYQWQPRACRNHQRLDVAPTHAKSIRPIAI